MNDKPGASHEGKQEEFTWSRSFKYIFVSGFFRPFGKFCLFKHFAKQDIPL